MATVKMLRDAPGPVVEYRAGLVYGVSDDVGAALVASGAAQWVGVAPAVVPGAPPETRAALDEPEDEPTRPRSRRRA